MVLNELCVFFIHISSHTFKVGIYLNISIYTYLFITNNNICIIYYICISSFIYIYIYYIYIYYIYIIYIYLYYVYMYIYEQKVLASYKIIRLILQPFTFHYITHRLHVLSSLFSYIINVFFYG